MVRRKQCVLSALVYLLLYISVYIVRITHDINKSYQIGKPVSNFFYSSGTTKEVTLIIIKSNTKRSVIEDLYNILFLCQIFSPSSNGYKNYGNKRN